MDFNLQSSVHTLDPIDRNRADTFVNAVAHLHLAEHFRKNQLGEYIIYLLCNLL